MNNGQVPIIGQQQLLMLNAAVAITPELHARLDQWSKKVGIPFHELGNTIFRLGLMGLSVHLGDNPPLDTEDAIRAIPIGENEIKGWEK
jgi:hypothetical protein